MRAGLCLLVVCRVRTGLERVRTVCEAVGIPRAPEGPYGDHPTHLPGGGDIRLLHPSEKAGRSPQVTVNVLGQRQWME